MSTEKYELCSSLSNDKASSLHHDLAHLLTTQPSVIVLDAHKLDLLQTACLQVLIAFIKECHAIDIEVVVEKPSTYLMKLGNYLNLVEALGLD